MDIVANHFNPRPPWGGRPGEKLRKIVYLGRISIHALRGEGDCRRAVAAVATVAFQSTPSVGRATRIAHCPLSRVYISIHALRGEGDDQSPARSARLGISIHALRGEGDRCGCASISAICFISIHALRGEGDVPILLHQRQICDFNPRPPWGGRPSSAKSTVVSDNFNPRPPWGGRRAGFMAQA